MRISRDSDSITAFPARDTSITRRLLSHTMRQRLTSELSRELTTSPTATRRLRNAASSECKQYNNRDDRPTECILTILLVDKLIPLCLYAFLLFTSNLIPTISYGNDRFLIDWLVGWLANWPFFNSSSKVYSIASCFSLISLTSLIILISLQQHSG